MFICACCKKVVGPRVPQIKKVVETKMVNHPVRYGKKKREDKKDLFVRPTNKIDNGGTGTQIVKEIAICPDCVNKG
jgi:hypothetical protein